MIGKYCALIAGGLVSFSVSLSAQEPEWANIGAGVSVIRGPSGGYILHELVGQTLPFSLGKKLSPTEYDFVGSVQWNGDYKSVVVGQDGRYGLVSGSGQVLVPTKYDWVSNCESEGYAKTYQGNQMGLFDCRTGTEVLSANWSYVSHPESKTGTFVGVKPGSRYGIYNLSGAEVHGAHHALIWRSMNGFYSATEGNDLVWISSTGKKLFKHDPDVRPQENGVIVRKGPDGKFGAQDLSGNWVIPASYDSLYCEGDLCQVRKDGKREAPYDAQTFRRRPPTEGPTNEWGIRSLPDGENLKLVDKSGKTILANIVPERGEEEGGYAIRPGGYIIAYTGRGWGVADTKGKVLAPFDHWHYMANSDMNRDAFSDWSEGAMVVKSPRGIGVFGSEGKWLIPIGKYDRIGVVTRLAGGNLGVEIENAAGQEGVYNLTLGREMVAPQYDRVLLREDYLLFWTPEVKTGVRVLASDREYAPGQYEYEDYHADSQRLTIKRGELLGLADVAGRVLVEPQYETLFFSDWSRRAFAVKGGQGGVIDMNGRVQGAWNLSPAGTLTPFFDRVQGTTTVRKDGQLAVVDTSGRVLAQAREFGTTSPENLYALGLLGQTSAVRARFTRASGGYHERLKIAGQVYQSAGGDIGTTEINAEFNEGLMAVRSKGLFGYIDITGRMIIAPRFDHASQFSEGIAIVQEAGQWFYIDRTGVKTNLLHSDIAVKMNSVMKE